MVLEHFGHHHGTGQPSLIAPGISTPAVMLGHGDSSWVRIARARLEVPIVPDHFAMRAEGKAADLRAEMLNRFLLTAMGVRVTSGRAHKATFGFRAANGKATRRNDSGLRQPGALRSWIDHPESRLTRS